MLENSFSDKLGKLATILNGNKYLTAVKDAFMFALPLTIVGSILVVIVNFPGISDDLNSTLNSIFGGTVTISLQLMSMFVAFGIGFYLSYNEDKEAIDALYVGLATLASYLILVPILSNDDGSFIPVTYLGASGMFLAIIQGILGAKIFMFLRGRNITIKMPDSVPPTVATSFSSLIPLGAVVIFATIISYIFSLTDTGNVIDVFYNVIQKPLSGLGTSYVGTLFAGIIINFLWFFGIHGSLTINPIFEAFWQSNALENLAAFNAGLELPHIVTKSFFDTFFISVGASGTLALVTSTLVFSKAKQHREVSKLGFGPAIFNVFEPIAFGMPIVLNPIFFIPWLLTPVVLISMAYFSMALGLVSYTTGVIVPWTVPVVISGFLATNSISGSILQIAQFAAMFFIWTPFVLIASKNAQNESEANIKLEE